MTHIRDKIAGYYGQVWENELMNISKAVLGVTELKDHVLVTKSIEAGTIYDADRQHLVIWQVVLVCL